ncbi:hypothetical protein EZV73_21205 [Acidaminobacter sp. JC074]|uniref:hypothetical protein n=1 Tax=Acidaminobacter sp. JC074 TaxID=2530199 RepID=UPI001F116F42|nr:hypothetical protein [Acidaminobacter sp. JC074]MCH4890112.1 hypothetical protein [Acidaminobacter sp. JC074]
MKKYRFLIIAFFVALLLNGMSLYQEIQSTREFEAFLIRYDKIEIDRISARNAMVDHSIQIKDDDIEELKDKLTRYDWEITSERYLSSDGQSSFYITFNGDEAISMRIIGKDYVSVLYGKDDSQEILQATMKVEWQESAYERVKELIKASK